MKRLLPLALLLAACAVDPEIYTLQLPVGFPEPYVPADNPLTVSKVELGRRLFYDKRLSGNQTFSCASCHQQSLAFTDGLPHALGSTGQAHPRGSMAVVNVAYGETFGWANPLLNSLEKQAIVPMFGDSPVELGLAGLDEQLIARVRAEPRYQELFPRAFPADADPFTVSHMTRAMSAFERTIISGSSAYDRYAYGGDPGAISESAKRGLELFNSERLECFHCHGGYNFSDAVTHTGKVFAEIIFHNTGLYDPYPDGNRGLQDISGKPEDMGKFKAPSLRNIAVTAPYMHDGSIATLGEVLDHYAKGGRARSTLTSGFLMGFTLSDAEKADVIAFLTSLTDETLLTDPRFADPW
jgi:cytochrome c peroxidase